MGRAVWTHTEPPLTIGRGLLITTGAIGGLLSIAVLWAMLPSAGRGGIAAPTVVASTTKELPSTVVTARADTLVATSVEGRVPSTTLRTGTPNTPASDDSTGATPGSPPETVSTQSSELNQTPPVAVGVGDSLIITTARAVNGRTTITLTGSDGQPHDATVLMVDRDLGLAVLSADAAGRPTSYGIGPAANPGDVVTVMGATPTSANVGVTADGHLTLDTWEDSTAEGTPVVNANGQLVGICSHGSAGPELVSVASVAAMLAPAKSQNAPWLGVHVATDAEGALTIDWVSPDGPSAAVGLGVGDTITAVDGVPLANVEALKAAIADHEPNDVITITVIHANQTTADIAVTLSTAPSM
jgi:S1-C subfamily serine protease